jgi:hypothetical protein
MERELADHGFLLRVETMDSLEPLLARWLRQHDVPYGIVVHRPPQKEFEARLRSLRDLLSHPGLRVPVLVDVNWQTGDFGRIPRGMHVLSYGNVSTTFGRAVARFLIDAGHREATFLYDYSRRFYLGFWGFLKARAELKLLDPSFGFRLALKLPAGWTPGSAALRRLLRSRLEERGLQAALQIYGYGSEEEMYGETFVWDSFDAVRRRCSGSRIWLFSRDMHAAEALEWAVSSRIAVPDRLAVVGLENDPQYCHLGLSRFEPDMERIGYLMAHAIIGDIPVARTTMGFIRTTARVVEKLTT